MNGLPYYKAYPRDFLEGTAGWPLDLKGSYRIVLDLIYMHGGELPDDPSYISGQIGCSVRKWNKLRADLIQRGKIAADRGIISNFRADFELETTRKYQDKQAENARGPRKNKDLHKPAHKPEQSHTDTDTEKKKGEANASPKKGTRLPDDWALPRAWGEWALGEGWPEDVIRQESLKFRDYWCGLSGQKAVKRDWLATWRNWMRNVSQQPKGGFSNGRQWEGRGDARAAALRERRAARKGFADADTGDHEMASGGAAFGCGPDGEDQGDAFALLPAGPEPGGGGSGPGGLDRRPRRFSDLGDCGGVHDVAEGESAEAPEPRWHPRVVHG